MGERQFRKLYEVSSILAIGSILKTLDSQPQVKID